MKGLKWIKFMPFAIIWRGEGLLGFEPTTISCSSNTEFHSLTLSLLCKLVVWRPCGHLKGVCCWILTYTWGSITGTGFSPTSFKRSSGTSAAIQRWRLASRYSRQPLLNEEKVPTWTDKKVHSCFPVSTEAKNRGSSSMCVYYSPGVFVFLLLRR